MTPRQLDLLDEITPTEPSTTQGSAPTTPAPVAPEPSRPSRSKPKPRARRTDPPTSHAAAASMEDAATTQRRKLLAYAAERGAYGLTANEADRHFHWRDGTAGRRLGELVRPAFRLLVAGSQTRMTESGRAAAVYTITDAGRAALSAEPGAFPVVGAP